MNQWVPAGRPDGTPPLRSELVFGHPLQASRRKHDATERLSAPTRASALSLALGSIALSLWAGVSLADSTSPGSDTFHVSGFGTVGISQINEPAGWAYTRNLDQANNTSRLRADLDSRLGLQVNYRPTNQFELVGQAVASREAPAANVGDAVELAFAAYRPDANWTLRAGRVNMDAFLLSDHRDVGITYEYVRPPVEFYSQTPTSLDGVDVSRVWTFADIQWRAKLFGGRSSAGTGASRLNLDPLVGVMVSRESDGLLLRVSAVHTRFSNTLELLQPLISGLHGVDALPVPDVVAQADALASKLSYDGVSTNYIAAGVQYDRHAWLLTAEINHAQVNDHPTSSFSSGYASLGRRFGPVSVFGVESVAVRSVSALTTPDWSTPLAPFGPAVAQQAQYLASVATLATNSLAGHQHTTSLGARWDLTAQLALKTQWDYIQTDANGGELWGTFTPGAGNANVISVVLDFVF